MDAEQEREFSAFVEASAHSLFRSALALTSHREQAEDLLQTVLARGARHWSRIRDNPRASPRVVDLAGLTTSTFDVPYHPRRRTHLRHHAPLIEG